MTKTLKSLFGSINTVAFLAASAPLALCTAQRASNGTFRRDGALRCGYG